MPTYDYYCPACSYKGSLVVSISERNNQTCPLGEPYFHVPLVRYLARAPISRIMGKVTPGGGPDKFTADMLGIPLKELPEGLKADFKEKPNGL